MHYFRGKPFPLGSKLDRQAGEFGTNLQFFRKMQPLLSYVFLMKITTKPVFRCFLLEILGIFL